MQTKTVDVQEAQTHLVELLSLVTTGIEIILMEGSTPLARIVPLGGAATPRVAGLHLGAIWTSEDFDEPLPEEFWTDAPVLDTTRERSAVPSGQQRGSCVENRRRTGVRDERATDHGLG